RRGVQTCDVMYGRDPGGCEVRERDPRAGERRLEVRGRKEVGEPLAGATVEDTGELPGGIVLHSATARRRLGRGVTRARDRERVRDVRAVDATQEHGVVAGDRVERAAVDGERRWARLAARFGFPGDGRADVAAGDPQALRDATRRLRDDRRYGVGIACLIERHAADPRGGVAEVRVRVDEAGQEHADAEVDDLGGRALERAHLTLVTDR